MNQADRVAWPCTIDEADFEQNTITLKMQGDYQVSAGTHWLSKTQPAVAPVHQKLVGVTDHQRFIISNIADKIEDGSLFRSGFYSPKELARFVRNMIDTTQPADVVQP